MTRIKIAKALIVFSFIFWIIYNSVFGWNMHSESELEKTFDLIHIFIWKVAFAIYLLPLLDLYEKKVKKHGRKN
jgi:hypothetical protein